MLFVATLFFWVWFIYQITGECTVYEIPVFISVFMSPLKLQNTCRYRPDRAKLWLQLSGRKKFTP